MTKPVRSGCLPATMRPVPSLGRLRYAAGLDLGGMQMSGQRYQCIRAMARDGVAIITLDRPDRLNAINARLKREVGEALDAIEGDDGIAAVVLAGAGRSFCSGFDLKDDAAAGVQGEAAWRQVLGDDFAFLMRFWEFPKPTIAAVQGHCLAGGFQMALCCDITIAANDAVFGSPELRFGSVVTAMMLPWIAGPKFAKEIILCAEDGIDAHRAQAMGIVNRVVAAGTLAEEAFALARRVAALDADVVRGTKAAINRSLELGGLGDGLRAALEAAVAMEALDTPSRRLFREITAADGLQAALAWRDARLASGSDDDRQNSG